MTTSKTHMAYFEEEDVLHLAISDEPLDSVQARMLQLARSG
jgi:hypothetical protein